MLAGYTGNYRFRTDYNDKPTPNKNNSSQVFPSKSATTAELVNEQFASACHSYHNHPLLLIICHLTLLADSKSWILSCNPCTWTWAFRNSSTHWPAADSYWFNCCCCSPIRFWKLNDQTFNWLNTSTLWQSNAIRSVGLFSAKLHLVTNNFIISQDPPWLSRIKTKSRNSKKTQ